MTVDDDEYLHDSHEEIEADANEEAGTIAGHLLD